MVRDSCPQSPVQKCIRVIAFVSPGSSIHGSASELQQVEVQQPGVFGLAKSSGDTDWSPMEWVSLVELLERQAGFSTQVGLSWRDREMLSQPGENMQDKFPSGGLLLVELERDAGRTPSV